MQPGGDRAERPAHDGAGQEQRLALALAVGVNERVHHDAEQPRLEVRAQGETMEAVPRPHERLLHEILGVFPLAGQPERPQVKLITVGRDLALESGSRIIADRAWLCHSRPH
jgi:hypothetical protein